MKTWKPLNMELRSWVISQVLRLEQTSNELMKVMLKMFNENSKTAGHQSSALSFKSKVDLFYDLEEIDKVEYNHLIKLMEIRNQFAHNSEATSFESLDTINPDLNKYLEKFEPKDLDKDLSREEKLKMTFSTLFQLVAGKLLVTEMEYTEGMRKEIRKHINDYVVEQLDEIWKSALEKNEKNKVPLPTFLKMKNSDNENEMLYLALRITISEFAQKEMKNLEGENLKRVFKSKEDLVKASDTVKVMKAE